MLTHVHASHQLSTKVRLYCIPHTSKIEDIQLPCIPRLLFGGFSESRLIKIVPQPGSETMFEPRRRRLLRISFLVTSIWSVNSDSHLLFGLIFYLSGRGVIHSKSNMFRIHRVIRVRSWSDMPFWKDSAFRSRSVDINLELQRSLVKTQGCKNPAGRKDWNKYMVLRLQFLRDTFYIHSCWFCFMSKTMFPHTKLANPMFCPIFSKQPTIIIDWWIPSLCRSNFPRVVEPIIDPESI